jgi:ATP-dependent Clp protease ATP-binding subunit ClpA
VAVREMALGRYGKEARSVVQLAEQSAVAAGDRELRAVHLLSGLLQQEGGAAAAVLRSLGVTHERIADQLTQPRSEGAPSEGEATVVAGGMYRLLAEAAPAHAGALNSASVDPTHLLLGLLTERGAGGRDLLEALGVHEDALLGRLAESLHERIAMQIRARAGA